MRNPTAAFCTSLNVAYKYFNRELFGGILAPCLITLQQHKGSFDYFSGGSFSIRQTAKTSPMKLL